MRSPTRGIERRASVVRAAGAWAGCVWLVLAAPLAAQQGTADGTRQKGRLVRLLAVGDPPMFRADLRDGVLREQELAEGTLPPDEVLAVLGEDGGAGVRTRLMLGGFSAPLEVPASLTVLRLRDAGRADADAWCELSLPEGEEPLLAVVWRDPDSKRWTRARGVVLRDGPASVPTGSVRVLNVTGALVAVRFGGDEQTVALRSGRSVVRRLPASGALPLAARLADGRGGWLPLFQGEASAGRGERVAVVVFRADGEQPRRPAKVAVLNDRVAQMPAADG